MKNLFNKYICFIAFIHLFSFCNGQNQSKTKPDHFKHTLEDSLSGKDTEFEGIRISPEFPGGVQSLNLYFNKNLEIPSVYLNESFRIAVSLDIDSVGNISSKKIIVNENECFECEPRIIHLIDKMPKWIPGINGDGKNMKNFSTDVTLFIEFKNKKLDCYTR